MILTGLGEPNFLESHVLLLSAPFLPVKIVSQVNADEHPSGRGVDTHVVSSVVEVFCTCVSLDVMGVVVTPAKLYINPVLLSRGTVHDVTAKDIQAYF